MLKRLIMSEKKEQALNEIKSSFDEMASLVLRQLTLLDKLMGATEEQAFTDLIVEMDKAESRMLHLDRSSLLSVLAEGNAV